MKTAALVCYLLGLAAELYVFRFLVCEVLKVRRAKTRAFVIDGGTASSESEQDGPGDTLNLFADALDQSNRAIAALAAGIMLGAAGNLLSLYS